MPKDGLASCLFSIMTDNCDDAYKQAVDAGAQSRGEPMDQFWGMRSAMVKDHHGYRWAFVQRIEKFSNEEIAARAQKLFGG
jgi:PhnB protein